MGIFSEHLGKKYTEETEYCLNNVIAKNEKYKKLLKKIIEVCPAGHKYNVFGTETDKVCCYRFHNYCENIENCYLKKMISEAING